MYICKWNRLSAFALLCACMCVCVSVCEVKRGMSNRATNTMKNVTKANSCNGYFVSSLECSHLCNGLLLDISFPVYDILEQRADGEPICVRTLSSHCSGPFRCSSIQQGVLVTVCRLYSAPQPLTKLIRMVHILVSWYTASKP